MANSWLQNYDFPPSAVREVRPRPRGQLATLVSDTDREDGIEKEEAKLIFPSPSRRGCI